MALLRAISIYNGRFFCFFCLHSQILLLTWQPPLSKSLSIPYTSTGRLREILPEATSFSYGHFLRFPKVSHYEIFHCAYSLRPFFESVPAVLSFEANSHSCFRWLLVLMWLFRRKVKGIFYQPPSTLPSPLLNTYYIGKQARGRESGLLLAPFRWEKNSTCRRSKNE